MIVGNFTRENTVFFEEFHDGARIADDLLGALFGRFLGFGIAVHEVDTMFEGRRSDIMKKAGEGLFLIMSEMPDDERDANAVIKHGGFVLVLIKVSVAETAGGADVAEMLHFGRGEVFEEPSGEFRRENLEVLAYRRGETVETAFFAGGEVEHFFAFAKETRFVRGGLDDFAFGDFVVGRFSRRSRHFGGGGTASDERGGFGGRLFIRNRHSGLFAGRTLVDFNPVLVEPELDFVVAGLVFGRHFENIDLGFAAAIEIVDDGVSNLGNHAGADIAFDAVFVLVHKEESVGLIEIFVKTLVDFGLAFGVIIITRGEPAAERKAGSGLSFVGGFWFGRDGARPINDFVAAAFEIATPVKCAFVELGAA